MAGPMPTDAGPATPALPRHSHAFQTRNLREGENAAHTRTGATARGFRGSIVGGAIVYGQMIRPLLEDLGERWLERSRFEVRFKAPAYDDDRVVTTVSAEPGENGGNVDPAVRLVARNDAGQELVDVRAALLDRLPAADALASVAPVPRQGDRVEGTWDRMVLGRALHPYRFRIDAGAQREYCQGTGDDLSIHLGGLRPPAHPGLVMAQGSHVVSNHFVMPFWIHASSTLVHRRVVRVGDEVELCCVPIEKWKRGESDWVRFYQVYRLEGEPAIEVWKTSVIKVAPRAQDSRHVNREAT
jgi:hypothetical protein